MSNINFILSDIERLKDKKSINSLVNNWELLSFNKSRAFTKILETVLDVCKSSDKITDKDLIQISESIAYKLLSGRSNYLDEELRYIKENIAQLSNDDKDVIINENLLNPLLDKITTLNKKLAIEYNHDKLNETIDIDNYIKENNIPYNESNAIEGIYDLCEKICTEYSDISIKHKLKICSENISHAYNKSGCSLSDNTIIENVLDYFLLKDKKSLSIIEDVLIDPKCKDDSKIKDKIDKLKLKDKKTDKDITLLLELDKEPIRVFLSKLLLDIKDSETYDNSKKIIDSIIKKLYRVPKDDLIEDVPHIIGFARRVILFGGSLAVSPYFILPVAILDTMIHQKVNRDECDKVLRSLNNEKKQIEKKLNTSDSKIKDELNKYLSVINSQIDRIETYKRSLYSELENDNVDIININREMATILAIEEDIFPGTHIEENTAVTILRTAREKITKNMEKASSAEKQASQTLDRNIEKLQQDIMSSVAIKERDRVIKGKILPSASKTIKWAISLGVAYAVNPAIAVIGALGAMAVAKQANARERQLILDEIEVHLKIVEKKISQAEMNNDLKNMENLLKIENKLQREKQRIKYRMKVYYNQNV